MGEFLEQIPENIRGHIKDITRSSGLPDSEESIEKIAEGWLEKKNALENKSSDMNMEEVEYLEKDDEGGALVLTYSGSLVTIGPLNEGSRKVEYASIGLRYDVPDLLSKDDCILGSDVMIGEEIVFDKGPIKKTSPIFKILVVKDELSIEEEEEHIKEAATLIMDDFIEVNKTMMLEEDEEDEEEFEAEVEIEAEI